MIHFSMHPVLYQISIQLLLPIIEVLLCLLLLHRITGLKKNIQVVLIACLYVALSGYIRYIYPNQVIWNLIITVSALSLLAVLSSKKPFYISLFASFIAIFIEGLTWLFFGLLNNWILGTYGLYIVSRLLSLFILSLVGPYLIKNAYLEELTDRELLHSQQATLIAANFTTLLLSLAIYSFFKQQWPDSTQWIIIFVLLSIQILLIGLLNRSLRQSIRNELINSSNQLIESHLEEMTREHERLNRYRHDFAAHLDHLNYLLKNGDTKEVQVLLESLIQAQPVNQTFETGNTYVNAVISSRQSAHPSISFQVNTSLEQHLGIDPHDFMSLLYNLLENACEAASLTDSAYVSVKLLNTTTHLLVEITNPSVHEKIVLNETTKPDKQNHGFGHRIVQDIIRKYHGKLYTNTQNHTITIHITLEKKAQSIH